MEKLKHIWYKIVANALLSKLASQTDELNELKRPRPLHADVNALLRVSLQNKLEQEGILKYRDDVRILNGKVDILRQQLYGSLAYIEYLQDVVRPHHEINFNELSSEIRQEYFKRVNDKVSA